MTEKRKYRFRSVLMAAFLLLLLATGREIRVQASEGQTFRALLVTRGDYQGTSIDLTPGPENDGENVKRMLEKAYGEENITVTVRDKTGVTTKSGLKNEIQTAFCDSTWEDINYFYYSGHGQENGLYLEQGTVLTPEELYDCFDGICGTNVIIMDCCYSGCFSKQTELSMGEQDTVQTTAEEFAADFAERFEDAAATDRQYRTVLNNSRFRMLLAASEEEVSNQTMENGSTPAVGMFTSSLVYGSGIDAMKVTAATEKSQYDLGVSPADFNGDGKISFSEIGRFIENCCVANHLRMYPADNEECFLPVRDEPAAAAFGKAAVLYDTDGTAQVEIDYYAREDTTADLAYYYSDEVWEIQNLLMRLTDKSGLPTLSISGYPWKQAEFRGINLKKGEGSFRFLVKDYGEGLKTGFYGCLIRPSGSQILYMVPFSIASAADSLLQNLKIEASERYCVQSGEEWEIMADFGIYSKETLALPGLDCRIYDGRGNLVRTLGVQETAQVITIGLTKTYRCMRRFYWNGCSDEGTPVPSGTYTVRVTAEDASGSIEQQREVQVCCGKDPETGDGESEKPTESSGESEQQTDTTGEGETETESTAGSGDTQTGQAAVKSIQAECVSVFAGSKKGVTRIVIGKKEKVRLLPVFTPEQASGGTVTYHSSKASVAAVRADGTVNAKKVGNTVITLQTPNGKTCRVKVTVRNAPAKLKLNAAAKTLKTGKSFQIKVTLPAKTASYSRKYTSSNKKVASVSASGKVKAGKKGKAVITVKLYNGKKARLKITVK